MYAWQAEIKFRTSPCLLCIEPTDPLLFIVEHQDAFQEADVHQRQHEEDGCSNPTSMPK
jgi:hypothetical protein